MTLKIEVGKYYRTRNGQKVGPMDYNSEDVHFFAMGWHYADNGECCYRGEHGRMAFSDRDLIAEWAEEPPIVLRKPAPNYASREEMVSAIPRPAWADAMDLTAITTPFGILPPETQKALRDHGGPYEAYTMEGWGDIGPMWINSTTYRVKPAPKRETVTIYGAPALGVQWVYTQCEYDTHRITFDLIDGTPDPASIRMEEL